MRETIITAALAATTAALFAAPALAQVDYAALAVRGGANEFFDAMAQDDEEVLASKLTEGAIFFVHDRRDPENPVIRTVTVEQYLEGWRNRTGEYSETMRFESVHIDGDMAHLWGPYAFSIDGEVSHCGVNSISMIEGDDFVWRVGNASFTMIPASECASIGVDWLEQ